jgi:hypothetical protein
VAGLAAAGLALALAGCSGDDATPAAPAPSSPVSSASSTPAAPVQETTPTRVGVGFVAGRLGSRKRAQVKADVTAVVDRYLDAAWVAGPWPRTDFSAAFADFRPGIAADAAGRDLGLLTHHDVGAAISGVVVDERRLRIDVLAPRGDVGAVTARVDLVLTSTPVDAAAPPLTTTVSGSLYLTRSGQAWKVFGYDVREDTA